MVSPVHGDYRRLQAETPLSDLFKFAEPALFLSGAGALNYGHNNHAIKASITEYLASDAVIHGLDMATPAKLEFMETFRSVILQERSMQYKFQFTGPTGANAIEAALKLSRKITGRQNIVSFTHGITG